MNTKQIKLTLPLDDGTVGVEISGQIVTGADSVNVGEEGGVDNVLIKYQPKGIAASANSVFASTSIFPEYVTGDLSSIFAQAMSDESIVGTDLETDVDMRARLGVRLMELIVQQPDGFTDVQALVPTATITNVRVDNSTITDTSTRIRWSSDPAADGFVRYGDSPDNMTFTGGPGGVFPSHFYALSGLMPETQYYGEVHAGGQIIPFGPWTTDNGSSGGSSATVDGTNVIVCLRRNGVDAPTNSYPYNPTADEYRSLKTPDHVIGEAVRRNPGSIDASISGVCVTLTFAAGEVPASPVNIEVS